MNVEELLRAKDVYFLPKGNDFLVSCLSPEHEDRHPSMRIDQVTGIFNCLSCGFKGNVFTLYGEKVNFLEMKRENLKRKINEQRASSIGLDVPKSAIPYRGSWRGISTETYTEFEAFQSHEQDHIGRIVFPIRDTTGRITAFIGRHTTGETPKYKITPPKAKTPLFPKVRPVQGSIVLVEGIYDMLNLKDNGMRNVVCCFGTQKVTEDKLRILMLQGTTRLDIIMDGDEAGQKAAKNIEALCENVGLLSRNVRLKDTDDPGTLSPQQIERLKTKLYG